MDRKLLSCIGYALRLSYRLELDQVSFHLKSALLCAREMHATCPPPQKISKKHLPMLANLRPSLEPVLGIDAAAQTDAHMCTEEDVQRMTDGWMRAWESKLQTLMEHNAALVRRTETIAQSRELELTSMESRLHSISDFCSAFASECKGADMSTSSFDWTAEMRGSSSLQLRMNHHREKRVAIKQQRRAARFQEACLNDQPKDKSLRRCDDNM